MGLLSFIFSHLMQFQMEWLWVTLRLQLLIILLGAEFVQRNLFQVTAILFGFPGLM